MPYKAKGKCVYSKGKKVGCSKDVGKYLMALNINVVKKERER